MRGLAASSVGPVPAEAIAAQQRAERHRLGLGLIPGRQRNGDRADLAAGERPYGRARRPAQSFRPGPVTCQILGLAQPDRDDQGSREL